MSLENGYRDLLVRVSDRVALLDGLSPNGFAWLHEHYKSNKANLSGLRCNELGYAISKMVTDGLTVEIRVA